MKFIDEVEIRVKSGHGGPGSVSFRRESMTPRGGPDGGDGGRGGDVIFKVSPQLNSLVDFRGLRLYSAKDGEAGSAANRTGADAPPLVLMVPRGTLIVGEDGEVLADLTDVSEVLLLSGGRGGKGNWFFKTSVNQAPEHAQPGEDGEELSIRLELKLIADVGIIGFPNAGKSTLISRISAARPKIADYPFTTLTPNLGVVKSGEFESFVVADIPGLVKGAHRGVGLGIQFLKHIERTRVFVHLIDTSSADPSAVCEAWSDINEELRMYDETNRDKEGFFALSQRPQLAVLNKIDTLTADQLERIEAQFFKTTGVRALAISAVSGRNLEKLIYSLRDFVFKKEEP